jgi:hypothetical protein
MEEIITAVISAVIAFIVPTVLKQFWPEPEQVDSLPWLKWCVAGFVGGALGGIASGAMGSVGGGIGNWAAFGVSIGIMQWFALRGYRSVGMWFIFASMLGWMLFVVGGPQGGWIVAGVAVGLMQYLSLTRWQGAAWWIVANFIAWPVAGAVGYGVGLLLLGSNPVLAWIVGWGVVGLVGAILLLWPLSRLQEKEYNHKAEKEISA